ncbi:MAG: type IV pilus modification protein PilV [Oceanospirillaceae bacterium]
MKNKRMSQTGSSLIEVLITIVVVSIGLLGMAALQLKSVAVNQSAYQRLQATNLAYEIADSIAINPTAAANGDYRLALADSSPQHAVVSSVADIDLTRWLAAVDNRLPAGDLIIAAPAVIAGAGSNARQYRITICWYDKNQDDIDNVCGAGVASFEFFASSKT